MTLFKETCNYDLQPVLISDKTGVYGADYTELSEVTQRSGVHELIQRASQNKSPIHLEIGYGVQTIKCPPGTLSIKTDLYSFSNIGIVLKQRSGFTGFFKLDGKTIPVSGAKLIYTIAPFPLAHTGEPNSTDLLKISLSSEAKLKKGGIFVVVYDPSFNDDVINRGKYPSHFTTEEALDKINNGLGGNADSGFLYKNQEDGRPSLHRRYRFNVDINTLLSNLKSDYFNSATMKNVKGLIYTKR